MFGQAKARGYARMELHPGKWVAVQGGGRSEAYRCTQIGLGGFFLECANPLPVGCAVRFAFEIDQYTVRGIASVRNRTARGMGLAILSMRAQDRAHLYRFITEHN